MLYHVRAALVRLHELFRRRSRYDAAQDDEFRFHLDMEIAENVRRGMSEPEARRAALLRFGGTQRWGEETQAARGVVALDNLARDARFALRSLRRDPFFTAMAVVTLAFGIGANTAIFSVVSATLIEPLRLGQPDRIGRLVPQHPEYGESDLSFALADLRDLQRQSRTIEHVAAYDAWRTTLDTREGAERVDGAIVSPNFFEALGVRPALGRFFTNGDEPFMEEPTVVLAYDLWRQRFGADSSLVGRRIRLSGREYVVAGVAPPDLEQLDLGRGGRRTPILWRAAPEAWFTGERAARGYRSVTAVARLRPGVDFERANAEVRTIFARLAAAHPAENAHWSARVTPLKERLIRPVRPALLTLLAASGLVLLIACANVGNLMLSRLTARSRELAIRTALGASRARIATQITAEALLLASGAAVVGAALAWLITRTVVVLGATHLPRLHAVTLDERTWIFTGALALLTGIVLGAAASYRAVGIAMPGALKDADSHATAGPGPRRLRWALLATETATAVALLTGAALLIQSLRNLYGVDTGIRTAGVITARVDLGSAGFESDREVRQAHERVVSAVRAVPGISAVGVVNILPFSGGYWQTDLTRPEADVDDTKSSAEIRAASPAYFSVMQVGLHSGRLLSDGDGDGAPSVALVNRLLADREWPGQNAVGRRLNVFETDYEIVGVVNDTRDFGFDRPPQPSIYLPVAQAPVWFVGSSYLVATGSMERASLAAIQNAVRSVNNRIPVSDVATMQTVVDRTTVTQRFRTLLLAVFGALALLLAGLGIHSVVSYDVAQRTREVGIRVALGASLFAVLGLIVRQEMRPILLGLGVGIIAASVVGRVLASFLYGVGAYDPLTIAAVVALLGIVGVVSALAPALRASRVDIVSALRNQ